MRPTPPKPWPKNSEPRSEPASRPPNRPPMPPKRDVRPALWAPVALWRVGLTGRE